MYWLISLFALEAILEAYLCTAGFAARRSLRVFFCYLCAIALVVATIGLTLGAWRVWLWTIPVSGYRLLNILRLYRYRLPEKQLRTVATRAFGWLLAGQVVLAVAAWFVSHFHLGSISIAVLAVMQLVVAIVLLRTSFHTWRHATVQDSAPRIMNKDLPSLSILVPARNETEQLHLCLQALIASDYPKLEIVVLDDCSVVRRTPKIIQGFAHDGVRFIAGTPPDENRWLAKNWAYEQLIRNASGELILFCGVDAYFEPTSIRQLVETLVDRQKDMLSVMPLRARRVGMDNAILQIMRYYWEMSLPRRLFKRPPVLSTAWLIRKQAMERMGGMESVSRSINPEAHFARQAVVTDAYSFIRSDERLGVYSNKPASEQYGTSVRVRYPQLHRRLELVALTAAFELIFFIGPLIALCLAAALTDNTIAYIAVWGAAVLCLLGTYGLVGTGSRLANKWYGWVFMPVAFIIDMVMLHISFWKYEFSTVDWKGRNICIPVMRIDQPKTEE